MTEPGAALVNRLKARPNIVRVKSLVLPPRARVEVQASDDAEELLVTVDGQGGTGMHAGQRLVVRRAERMVQLVRFPQMTFFARLRRKLGWGGLPERDDTASRC